MKTVFYELHDAFQRARTGAVHEGLKLDQSTDKCNAASITQHQFLAAGHHHGGIWADATASHVKLFSFLEGDCIPVSVSLAALLDCSHSGHIQARLQPASTQAHCPAVFVCRLCAALPSHAAPLCCLHCCVSRGCSMSNAPHGLFVCVPAAVTTLTVCFAGDDEDAGPRRGNMATHLAEYHWAACSRLVCMEGYMSSALYAASMAKDPSLFPWAFFLMLELTLWAVQARHCRLRPAHMAPAGEASGGCGHHAALLEHVGRPVAILLLPSLGPAPCCYAAFSVCYLLLLR